jgi:Flp pilus assembly pilin Flp
VAIVFAPDDAVLQIAGRSDEQMIPQIYKLLMNDDGQDIAEYAVMLAVILVLVVGTVRLVGSNSNNVFSSVASAIQ